MKKIGIILKNKIRDKRKTNLIKNKYIEMMEEKGFLVFLIPNVDVIEDNYLNFLDALLITSDDLTTYDFVLKAIKLDKALIVNKKGNKLIENIETKEGIKVLNKSYLK